MLSFFAYMLRCADGSYYVGHTENLDVRVAQHSEGTIQGYTSKRRPVTLVWLTETANREDAKQIEHHVKGWSRAKKEALIAGDWDALRQLAKRRT